MKCACWLARLDGKMPQVECAKRLHCRFDVVFFTHRYTTAGQNQVVIVRCALQRLHSSLQPVRHDAQVTDFTAQALQQRAQEETV